MLEKEESLKGEILAAFPTLDGQIRVQRARRLWVETTPDQFQDLLGFLVQKLGVVTLCTITGLDEGETLGFLYHLARQDGIVVNVKNSVPKSIPVIQSVTDLFPGAVFYERELVDLLGAQVENLPSGHRYPLRDDWPEGQYPLRKDWNPSMLDGKAEK